MIALTVTIFVASLVGSLHCAGMCGAFLAIACGGEKSARTQSAYHGGRLVTYMALGAVAGGLGGILNLAGGLAGVTRAAVILAGVWMVGFGVVMLAGQMGVGVGRWTPKWMQRFSSAGLGLAMKRGVVARAGMIGLLTTLLPCGWLYAFVAAAGGSGSVWSGMGIMAVFWSGTLPVMVGLGAGVRQVLGLGRQRQWVNVAACGAMIAMGSWTVVGRGHLSVEKLVSVASSQVKASVVSVEEKPACCQGK